MEAYSDVINGLLIVVLVHTIEIEGLECVVSHVTRNDHGESKWYQHIGKKTARSHSLQ